LPACCWPSRWARPPRAATPSQAFLEQAVAPIGARLATPIAPEVRQVLAQGDAVVVLWDGMAARRDGGVYRNSYAWHLVFDGGRIVRATAFLDTWALQRLMED
jgi:ketosteroid isomerase-like protein